MAYTFELRPLKSPLVLDQLAAALREREDRLSLPREKRDSPAERRRRRVRRYRVYLGALALMGLGLLLRGAVIPGLALALCCGAWLLWSREPRPPAPRTVSAERLVGELKRAERNGARVTFSEETMSLLAADGRREDVEYEALEFGFESDDLLVLTGERRAVALQKLELTWGDWEDFRAFLSERVGRLVDMRIKRKA